VLYGVTNAAEFPHLFALREEMRFWRLLQLDPVLLRKPAPATATDVLSADGSNLAAVLAQLKVETATSTQPDGVLSDIAAELNNLIAGVTKLDAQLHPASREYRIALTMRDGLPFSSRVVSDGTLRVLALLTLLHDPRHRGLICFEEPENGVHPARLRQLVQCLRDMVTVPGDEIPVDNPAPLSQLLVNSHSPVVLAALVDRERHPVTGSILFADTATVTDPEKKEPAAERDCAWYARSLNPPCRALMNRREALFPTMKCRKSWKQSKPRIEDALSGSRSVCGRKDGLPVSKPFAAALV